MERKMMNEKQFHRTYNLSSRQIVYLAIVMILALLTLLPTKSVAANNNDETVVIDGISYYVLRTTADWTRLGQLVTEADGKSDVNAIKIATTGEDPHGIIIPGQWQWPTETTCIKEAYPDFNTWASDHTKAKDWYNNPKAGKVVKR